MTSSLFSRYNYYYNHSLIISFDSMLQYILVIASYTSITILIIVLVKRSDQTSYKHFPNNISTIDSSMTMIVLQGKKRGLEQLSVVISIVIPTSVVSVVSVVCMGTYVSLGVQEPLG